MNGTAIIEGRGPKLGKGILAASLADWYGIGPHAIIRDRTAGALLGW